MKEINRWFLTSAILLLVSSPLRSQQANYALNHHVRTVVSSGQAAPVGTLPATERLHLSIVLPLHDQDGLTRLLGRIYDPSSPDFRHFLSVGEFTNQFAPSVDEYQGVVDFARSRGFAVTGLAANRLVVPISATVEQIERAFNVKMRLYRHPTENREFFSPDREPSLPLGVNVVHIAGLNNFSIPHPTVTKASDPRPLDASALSGSGPSGLFLGSDMRAAYYGGTALTGMGQVVGLVEFDGFSQSDVDLTFNSAGQFYSVPVEKVLVSDATGAACQYSYPCTDTEQVVDIAQAIGMAPGLSQVRVYIGGGDAEVLNTIATENLAKEVSISWSWSPDDPTTDDPFFEEFAAQGQSVYVSSGDVGTYTSDNYVYPAESAYVTAVGATDLVTSGPAGAWVSETAWSQSEGGISPDYIPIPSWQFGIANASNGASATLRNVPDVALEGNTDNYYCAQGSCTGSVGGTSLAAPRWAAFTALVNEQGQNAGDPLVGFVNPALYTLAEASSGATDLHDIVSGSNDYNGTCSGQAFCQAVPGYDLVTGWGSPAGQPLMDALAPPSNKQGFALSSSANSLTVIPGGSAATTITVKGKGGFTGSVDFAVSGLPTGISATWSANPPVTGSQLTFSVSANAQRGSYGVTITGTSGTQTATTVLTLGVDALGFGIYPVPGDLQTPQGGGSVSTTISVERFDGFSGNIGLAIATPLPAGVTAWWTQDPASDATMLTFNADATTPTGTTMLTILGTSGDLSATTTVSFDVVNPSVMLSSSPTYLPLSRGGSATTTITAVPWGAPHGPFTLSTYDLPSGVSVTFNPSSISAGQTSQATVTTDGTTPLGTTGLFVEGSPQSSSDWYAYSGIGIIVTATPEPSASVSLSPGYAVLGQGGSATVNVAVNAQNGFNEPEYLYIAPPSGVTASFTQNPTSSSSVLTLTASATAQPGLSNVGLCYSTNSGACNGFVDDFFVLVQPPAGFSLTSSAPSMTMPPGGTASATISVVPQTGFTGAVQLSFVSSLPQGVSTAFSQNPTTGSSVLTISASSAALPGVYPLAVAGSSGSQIVTVDLQLTISPTVSKNGTTTMLSVPNSVTLGASVTLTATVIPAASTGTVMFMNGTTTLGPGTLSNGTASLTLAATTANGFTVGLDSITAVYGGDGNESGSTSTAATLVVAENTTTSVAASPSSIALGSSSATQSLTATVTTTSGTPAGTVTFTVGGVTVGSAPLNSGSAMLSVAPTTANGFTVGTDTVTASYFPASGSGFNASSGARSMTVSAPAYTITPPATVSMSKGSSQSVTITFASTTFADNLTWSATTSSRLITVNPSSGTATLSANGSSAANLTITASNSAGNHAPRLPWTGGLIAFGVVLAVAPMARRRKQLMAVLLTALVISTLAFLMSCGGGGNTTTVSPRSYTVTISGTGGVSSTLSVTVQ